MVTPKVYLVGYTAIDEAGMGAYLRDTGNEPFWDSVRAARGEGLSDGEVMASFYAKLCYNSLSEGKNLNVKGTRDIPGNLRGCFDQGHGSVFEHATVNLVVSNASRVYETEQVRHRVGVAYSILSGRYERREFLPLVLDPVLREAGIMRQDEEAELVLALEKYMRTCNGRIDALKADRDTKKKLTSAMRRLMPQGIAREIGVTLNFRALRQLVQLRTSRHAEWEIRTVYEQVYRVVRAKCPLLFYGAEEEVVDGVTEVRGMKLQPWEK